VSSSWAKRAEKETRPLVRFRDIENPLNAHTCSSLCVSIAWISLTLALRHNGTLRSP
jgi:hypothetical protein